MTIIALLGKISIVICSIGIPFLFFLNMGHQQIQGSEIIVSPVRNQGYRKYFEMNQKYGLAVKKTGH